MDAISFSGSFAAVPAFTMTKLAHFDVSTIFCIFECYISFCDVSCAKILTIIIMNISGLDSGSEKGIGRPSGHAANVGVKSIASLDTVKFCVCIKKLVVLTFETRARIKGFVAPTTALSIARNVTRLKNIWFNDLKWDLKKSILI